MSMKERARYYYLEQGKGCPDAILLAANEIYGLGLTEGEVQMLSGFRGGMGCGSTCGALAGSLGVLARKYAGREDLRDLCGRLVAAFEEALGCGTTECKALAAKYKTEEAKCVATVELGAQALEDFIGQLEGGGEAAGAAQDGCTLAPEDIKRVKALGFLHHKGTNKFNGRIITRNGRITAEESEAVSLAAKRYGDGHIMMTTRLTLEVSGIDYNDIEAFRAQLAQAGLETGGTGSKVRPVVSCKGATCQYGLYDTYDLSQEIHERFFKGYRNVTLPHKFKIAVGGCPNNCVKPNLNDVGIAGIRIPDYDPEKCKGCKKCKMEQACHVQAARMVEGRLAIDRELCNNCGLCIGKCPFQCCDTGTYGWRIYVGGRWGKQVAHGRMLDKIFTDRQEVFDVVEKVILFFRSQGLTGERLSDTISRIGFDAAQEMILGDALLRDKVDILDKEVEGGATC